MTRSLRGLGIKRNEVGKAKPSVMWRCDTHHRLNHPDHPGCGCPSPLDRAVLQDDAELRACRQMKWQDPRSGSVGRGQRLDYRELAKAPGTCRAVAAQLGCSAWLVSKARRVTA